MPHSLSNQEEPSSVGVTVRSRRRVQRLASASASSNKENEGSKAKSKEGDRPTRKRGKGRAARDLQTEDEGADNQIHSSSEKFQTALESISSETLLRRNPALAEQVIRASQSMSKRSGACLVLEEHEVELLSNCRAMIKQSTEETDPELILQILHVALHQLRALSTFQFDIKRQEATLKLLYHTVTSALDIFKSSESCSMNQVASMVLSLAAFEAMGTLLRRYTAPASKDKKVIAFVVKASNSHDDNILLKIFPNPVERTRNGMSCGALPLCKVFAIGLQAAMAAFTIIIKAPSLSPTNAECAQAVAEFGNFPSNVLVQTREKFDHQFELSTSLYDHIILPWIQVFASSVGPECYDDIVLHGKRAHRTFWEAASEMNESHVDGQDWALRLRQRSIMALLLCSNNELPLPCLRPVLTEKVMDVACTYAWKAVASYSGRSLESNPSAAQKMILRSFHEEVGPAIDCLDWGDNFSYAEYCAYRALHLGPGHCDVKFFCQRHERLDGSGCQPSSLSLSQMTFDLFMLALSLNFSLDSSVRDGYGNQKLNEIDVQLVIDRFRSTELECSDVGSLTRCYKILALSSLPKNVYNVLKDASWEPNPAECLMLQSAARVLAHCMGPLCVKLLSSKSLAKPDTRRFWDTSVECFIRALSAYARLLTLDPKVVTKLPISLADIKAETDAVATNLVNLLTGDNASRTAPMECLEKAAKTLSVIGKRLLDRGDHSSAALPIMQSIQLFTRLSSQTGDRLEDNRQPLSMRWFHLASVLHLGGMADEACMALVASLTVASREATECASVIDPLDLIHFFASLTKGGFATGRVVSGSNEPSGQIIGRLLSLFCERKQPTTSPPESSKVVALSLSLTLNLLSSVLGKCNNSRGGVLEEMFVLKCGVRFGLCGLLRVMFLASSECSGQSSKAERVLFKQVKILAEIVVAFGFRCQMISDRIDQEIQLEEFQHLLRLVAPLLRKLASQRDEVATPLLVSFYVVAAHALHPFFGMGMMARNAVELGCDEQIVNSPLLTLAQRVLGKAQDVIKRSETQVASEWGTILTALQLVVGSYHMQLIDLLARHGSRDQNVCHFRLCLDATQPLQNITTSSQVFEASRSCLWWELVRFHDKLSFDGILLAAACIAECIQRLARLGADGEEQWSHALALSAAIKADVPVTAPNVIDVMQVKNNPRRAEDIWIYLAQIELASVEMRLNISDTSGKELQLIAKNAIETFGSLENESPTHLMQWVSGSVAASISEILEASGDLRESLLWLRRCLRICSQSLDTVKRQHDRVCSTPSEVPLWIKATAATQLVRLSERHLYCLHRISLLYAKLGNHRKSKGYALTAAENAGILPTCPELPSGIEALASSSLSVSASNRDLMSRRLLVRVQAQAMALDNVVRAFANLNIQQRRVQQSSNSDAFAQNLILNRIASLLVVCDSMYGNRLVCEESHFLVYYQEARRLYLQLKEQDVSFGIYCGPQNASPSHKNKVFPATHSRLSLQEIRSTIHSRKQHDQAAQLCSEVTVSPSSTHECRTWALYYLGIIELQRARRDGQLNHLWLGHSNVCDSNTPNRSTKVNSTSSLLKAREHFLSALSCNGLTPSLLTRNILRSLALVTGPQVDPQQLGFSADALVQSSLGIFARQSVFQAIVDGAERSSCTNRRKERAAAAIELFAGLDTCFLDAHERNRRVARMYEIIRAHCPENWRTLSACLCPTGEILLTTMEVVQDELETFTVCVFPECSSDDSYSSKIYDDILKPFDEIIERSQLQLREVDQSSEFQRVDDESSKRRWWKARSTLDSELEEHIDHIEEVYFSEGSVQQAILGSRTTSTEYRCDSPELCRGNLADKFEAAVDFTAVKSSLVFKSVSRQVEQMSVDFESLSVSKAKRPSHGIDDSEYQQGASNDDEDECLFLILDENLHRFPFEGMSCFEGWAICRIPSLPFVALNLVEMAGIGTTLHLDPLRASFILDPESNLSETQNRLLPVIESINSKHNWGWDGVVGSIPSTSFVEKALTRNNGLFLYCGHGAGQVCYPRKNVERLLNNSANDELGDSSTTASETRLCRAAVILMGCSSGRLVSVNKKNSKSFENLPLHFEPEGIALSYLCAGAPCVVSNLWDVTDRDIDRYSIALLNMFLLDHTEYPRRSLARCVADARAACKLRYLVGCAPVCYGVPIHVGASKKRP